MAEKELQSEQTTVPEGLKLYEASSVVPEYGGYKDVTFSWFVYERESPPAEYRRVIRGYDELNEQDRWYSEGFIDSLFTADEVEQLRAYLLRAHSDNDVRVEEVELPAPNNIGSVGSIAVGGGNDFYMLTLDPEYDLPFDVWGYYDLRRHMEEREREVVEDARRAVAILQQHESVQGAIDILQQRIDRHELQERQQLWEGGSAELRTELPFDPDELPW